MSMTICQKYLFFFLENEKFLLFFSLWNSGDSQINPIPLRFCKRSRKGGFDLEGTARNIFFRHSMRVCDFLSKNVFVRLHEMFSTPVGSSVSRTKRKITHVKKKVEKCLFHDENTCDGKFLSLNDNELIKKKGHLNRRITDQKRNSLYYKIFINHDINQHFYRCWKIFRNLEIGFLSRFHNCLYKAIFCRNINSFSCSTFHHLVPKFASTLSNHITTSFSSHYFRMS